MTGKKRNKVEIQKLQKYAGDSRRVDISRVSFAMVLVFSL